jgi:hydroxymethylpyrimidine/phosphomethylpyrimidine kinase
MEEAARRIRALGPAFVLVKGGHLAGKATDLLFDGSGFERYEAARLRTTCTHGAGCTFSAAVAAGLARGQSVKEAVAAAKRFVTRAISEGVSPGHGHGTLNQRMPR